MFDLLGEYLHPHFPAAEQQPAVCAAVLEVRREMELKTWDAHRLALAPWEEGRVSLFPALFCQGSRKLSTLRPREEG